MGRYRPPAAKQSPYITRPGFETLQKETQQLWARRTEVTKALSAAAAEGDRSENAEYIYRKKQLREIDYRIRYLQKRLPELTIVSRPPDNTQQVFFGAQVTLKSRDNKQVTYRLLGPDEIDPSQGCISMDSPVARALLRKSIDDEVHVTTPQGLIEYVIIDIYYN